MLFVPVVWLGLSRLRLGTDVLDLLPPHQPAVQGLKLYQQHFANARELILTIKASDAEQASTVAKETAAWLRQETNLITAVAWQPPWMEDPVQLGELLAFIRLNQEPHAFGEMTNRLTPGNLKSVLAETREVLATSLSPLEMARHAFDPYGLIELPGSNSLGGASLANPQAMFGSEDGSFRILYVQSRQDLTRYTACQTWLQAVRGSVSHLVATRPEWKGVVFKYTGRPVFVAEIAGSMERDMRGSVIGTAAVIALLFWLAHRRWLPMIWLLVLLALILMGTLALGSLVLGSISVVSMGFVAILLGLAVDYALVHYQEALAHPLATVPEIRRAIAPSIVWAAVTTISAFLVLNLGGLPGLAQLGSLVAIGVALSAVVMVWGYLPPLFRDRLKLRETHSPTSSNAVSPTRPELDSAPSSSPSRRKWPMLAALSLLGFCLVVLAVRRPALDKSANSLRPAHSDAENALEEMQSALGLPAEPLWVVVSGKDEPDVYERLIKAENFLNHARTQGAIGEYLLPTILWPRPEYQRANQGAARILGDRSEILRETAIQEGFTPESLRFTQEILRTFSRNDGKTGVLWPTNATSQWIFKRFVAHPTNAWLVLGLVYPATHPVATAIQQELLSEMPDPQIWLSGWQLLGASTLKVVRENLWPMVLPMVFLVLVSLWMAFRRLIEMLLGMGVLLLSLLCLLATMVLAGWSWNLLNLMSLPLILGTGIDYSIFMQLALRRCRGDLSLARQSVGRALLLCGGTAVTGFGSLAWSSNPGMASLGKACAIGIGANMLIAVFLLPAAWSIFANRRQSAFDNKTPSR